MQQKISQKLAVNNWMNEHGARFAVTRQGIRSVNHNPYDPIPRILSAEEFTYIEQGLIQRINAINLFLNDIYQARMILRDGVIPEEFIYSSPDFHPQCMNIAPPKNIYTHVTATDLVRSKDGHWYVMEDCISMPDGITYPHFARKICRETFPEAFEISGLCDNCGLDILLKALYHDILDHDPILDGGLVVLLGEGEESLAAFELRYIAELTGAVVADPTRLIVMDNRVYYRAPEGGFKKVSILHRLVPDRKLDPLCFDMDTEFGIPHLMEVYASGNIAIINAPGCSVAEDQGLSAMVPLMIRYYLDEDPILPMVPTYLPWYSDQMHYIEDHFNNLVIKEVASDRRHGAVYPSKLSEEKRSELLNQLRLNPRYYIAQEVIEVEELPVLSGAETTLARCDFRAYTVHSDSLRVWMGGLTRFTVKNPDGSPMSGFKDTLVMSK